VGGSGNDIIYSTTGNTTITGGSGHESITGGSGNDIIYSTTGNTTITGGSGHETITGGSGNDIIYATTGNTTITGGSGHETLVGGSGNDIIYATTGNTTITGGSGHETLVGGSGNDIIYATTGNTTITGGSGSETLVGGSGNDIIYGNTATAIIIGGSGNSTITGGQGNDIIVGGSGNDCVVGGSGDDQILGGTGNDSITGGSGNDTITGGSGDDTIFGGSGNDLIGGGTGDDSIVGGTGTDTITGGSGDDIIYATLTGSTSGNDSLVGGTGDSSIFGGTGNDTIYGGTGNNTIIAGDGNDSILGGSGNDLIYGGTGNSTLDGGTGNASISGGGGSDLITAGGFDSWLLVYGSMNMTLTNTTLTTSGGGTPTATSTISGFQNAILAAGTGNFTLNASAFSGNTLLMAGTGNDTLIGSGSNDTLIGGAGNDSLVGGGGNDTFAFDSGSAGGDVVVEPAGNNIATLDFSAASAGIQINLSQTGPQTVIPGTLTLSLSDPNGISNVLGSPYNDSIIGNARDNTLLGGGGQDLIAGLGGNDVIEGGITRTVYLDFDTDTTPGDHIYTSDERNAIEAQLTADYSAFSYAFTQTPPSSGQYTTIFFNDPALTGLEGGSATSIDWRDLDLSGSTTLTDSGLEVIPQDEASVNVANLLGQAGEPAATSADFIALSVTIAAHELGHLSGLEHGDAYGPIGSGIYVGVNPHLYRPPYAGPVAADETIRHIMASGASVNETLFQAIADPYFGEREAVKLAYGEDGDPTSEQTSPHYSMVSAQPIALAPLVVPDTDLAGFNADQVFDVTAADVVGQMGLDASGDSETDYYSFTAQAGTLINLQAMSVVLNRPQGAFDTTLTVYNSSGQQIAFDDDSFQDTDSTIIDLTLPATGIYYVEVTPYSAPGQPSHQTGAYELFMYTFATNGDPPAGDTMYAGSGDDTLVAGAGDDTIAAQLPKDTIVNGSGTATVLSSAPYLNVTAGQNQTVNEGTTVTLTGSFIDPFGNATHTYDWHVVATSGQVIPDGTGPTFTFSPGDAGTYKVFYTASDSNGGAGSTMVVITSDAVPPVLVAPTGALSAVAGASAPVNLGTLNAAGIGPFTVTVQWGDGQSSSFSTTSPGPLSAAHTYAREGTYTISESVLDFDGESASITFPAPINVTDAPLLMTGIPVSAVQGLPTGTVNVATFTDPEGADPLGDYSASVNWGDGQPPTVGMIGYNSSTGVFIVSGSYTYAQAGNDTITVAVTHNAPPTGTTTTVTSPATIAPSVTSTTLAASPANPVYGQAVTITATVAGYGTPGGTVTFYSGAVSPADQIGSGTLSVVNGLDQASFSISTLTVTSSPYAITAVYKGDASHQGSQSSVLSEKISQDATTITASSASGSFGQVFTLSAAVVSQAPGSGTPTGTVDFFDTTTSDDLGKATLSGGRATLPVSDLAPGAHSITATYSGDSNFRTSTTALTTVTVNPSIIVLDPTAAGALSISGNASIKVSGGVYVDSNSASALSASQNANITASVIDVHGGVSKSGFASFSPAPVTKAASVADPLAGLLVPSLTGLTNYGSETLTGTSQATIKPGIYSAITVSLNAKLTMGAGLYIIEGGGFQVSGNASVTGTGVTIYNAGSKFPAAGGTTGAISLSGNGTIKLTPASTGPYAGIVFVQPASNTQALSLASNAVAGITGTIYAPAAQLAASGNAQLNLTLDVDTLTLSGNVVASGVAQASQAGPCASIAVQPAATLVVNTAPVAASSPTVSTNIGIATVNAYAGATTLPAQAASGTSIGTAPSEQSPSSAIALGQETPADAAPVITANEAGAAEWSTVDMIMAPRHGAAVAEWVLDDLVSDLFGSRRELTRSESAASERSIAVVTLGPAGQFAAGSKDPLPPRVPAGPLSRREGRDQAEDRLKSLAMFLAVGGFCGVGAALRENGDARCRRIPTIRSFLKYRTTP
jgi:Ca2+-binding RTX toxin-like protein